ncbi:hypothetical protein Tco_0685082 [Tanacetum coccineum]
MSKLLYIRFTKLIINHFLSCNKSIPRRSNSELHSTQDDQPITKLSNTVKGDYKFGMEIPDIMISDAIKKSTGCNYFIAKKKEIMNVPNKLKKDAVLRKTRTLNIAKETVIGHIVKDPAVQSLLDLQKRSKASRLKNLKQKNQTVVGEGSSNAHNKHYVDSDTDSDAILYSSCSEERENETDDADASDMDLSNDNLDRGNDAAGFDMFMYNNSTKTPKSTYLSPTVTSSLLDFIHNLLNETPANELTDLVSNPVYTDPHTTSAVIYPEGNPELTRYISGASKVLLAFEKAIQARVLIEIKKLLPTHIPKAVVNYVRHRLNISVLYVMKNNQINLFTQSSTSTNDLLKMDLKLKLLNRIHFNNLNETHNTHQQLYDTLYESITLDQDALNAQNAEPSFHKRSSRQNKYPMVHAPENTYDDQPQDQIDLLIQQHSNPGWFTKKSGSVNAIRKTTWFDLLSKSDIDQNKNHILRPSTMAIAKKLKAIIQKDKLTIADLKGAGLERLKQQYQNDVELEYHDQLKATVLTEAKLNSIEDMIPDKWSKETHRCVFEALNGIHHWEDGIIDFFKAEMSTKTEGSVYSDLRIKPVVRIVVKKKWGYGFLTSIIVRRSEDKEY